MIKKFFRKIVILILIFSPPFISSTNAYLLDTENSLGNSFTAAVLDFSLDPKTLTFRFLKAMLILDLRLMKT